MEKITIFSSFIRTCVVAVTVLAGAPVSANPVGGSVVNGAASFQTSANTLTVTNTPGTIINWQSFGIAANEVTRFVQQSASSAVLNRVTGGDPSAILGQLQSNGQVYLVNPNGIVFGQNAVIDTAGLIASTLNLSNQDFLANRLKFEDLANNAEILNQGFIHTSNDGEVVLVAPTIKNEGVIDVEQGKLVLAAGQSVTISSLNYDNIEFEVQAPDNAVVNLGELMSDGGSIGVFAGSISNRGAINANAITVNDAGNIVLVANDVMLEQDSVVSASAANGQGGVVAIRANSNDSARPGTLLHNGVIEANGLNGGVVSAEADRIIMSGGVAADGVGQGGSVKLSASQTQRATTQAQVSANSQYGFAGDIEVYAGDSLLTGARYSATGYKGGDIKLLGPQTVSLAGAQVDASGSILGGGQIRVGGGLQGGEGLVTAASTIVSQSAWLDASSSLSGNGGTVAVWSDQKTLFAGTIDISAGEASGNGGFAEVSSKGGFGYGGEVIRSASNGEAGTLKLDPVDITIAAGSGGGGLSPIELLDPTIGANDQFGGSFSPTAFFDGFTVVPMANGNIFVADPVATGGTGEVYLFDSTGGLLSTLSGSASTDNVGNGNLIPVGLFDAVVVSSTNWNGVGAWTFITQNGNVGGSSGPTGGVVGSNNSLVGSTAGDGVNARVIRLNNVTGDYVVALPFWDDPTQAISDVGSVTVANGAGVGNNAGTIGAPTLSIVGATAGDNIGLTVVPSNDLQTFSGNFMVGSPNYDSASAIDGGIAFLVDSTGQFVVGGGVGVVSDSRGLFGVNLADNISSNGIYVVGSNSADFLVASPLVDFPSLASDGGAVTFINGATGEIGGSGQLTGSPDNTNSLAGNIANSKVGSGRILRLIGVNAGAYVIASPDWNNAIGAVTRGSGPITGFLDPTSSITGGLDGDNIGDILDVLPNGNFVVGSIRWTDNGAGSFRGAVTIGNGATGALLSTSQFGAVDTTNSLYGTTNFDSIGSTVVVLENSNVVVGATSWNNGAVADVGSVTLINGATGEIASQAGLTGATPDATNSIIGGAAGDQVGSDIIDIGGGTNNFAILSGSWKNTGGVDVGAVTLANGNTGTFLLTGGYGAVSAANSFTGSTSGDFLGGKLFALDNGNFIAATPGWDDFNNTIANVGAVTFVNGATGAYGVGGNGGTTGNIDSSTSLVGASPNDTISAEQIDGFTYYVMILQNGDYVLGSPVYDDVANSLTDSGVITVGDGTSGSAGPIDSPSSWLGVNSGDRFGSGNFLETFDNTGRFISHNPDANGSAGRVFLIDPAGAASPVGNVSFSDSQGSSLTISAQDLANALAGGAIILQASNDIILDPGADVIVNANGQGGDLTLQAGRSILLNANITTDNGKLVLIANDPGAVTGDRVAGNALIQQAAGATIDTGTGNLEIIMSNPATPLVGTPGDDIILDTIKAGHVAILQQSSSDASDILSTGAGTISASSVFMSSEASNGSTIGTAALPLFIGSDSIAAHIQGVTGGSNEGIYLNATNGGSGVVTVGDTCYGLSLAAAGCDSLGTFTIRGITTLAGGDIVVNFLSGDAVLFAQNDGMEYGINGSGNTVDLVVPSGSLTADANITSTAGALNIVANGNVALTNTAGVNPQINNSFGDIAISAGANSSFTMAAGTSLVGTGSPGSLVVIDAGSSITLGDVNASGYTFKVNNDASTGSGSITSLAGTRVIADVLDITATNDVNLFTQVNKLTALSGLTGVGDLNITNAGSPLDVIAVDVGNTANAGNLGIFNDQNILISGGVSVYSGDIDILSTAGNVDIQAGVSTITGGLLISIDAAGDLTVNANISSAGTINLGADFDVNGAGNLVVNNTGLSTLALNAAGDIDMTGADVLIQGGVNPGADILINSSSGSVRVNAQVLDINIAGGSGANAGVRLQGNNSLDTDVSLTAPGEVNLTAGAGDGSSVAIVATNNALPTGVSISASFLDIGNLAAGINSDAYIEAVAGAANVVVPATCAGCTGVTDPASTVGSQAGIWALNFPVGGTLFTWVGSVNSTDWATASNWDLNAVPTAADNVVIGLFTVDINTAESVNNLTLNGGTLQLGSTGVLTIGGTASLDSASTLTLNSGNLTANGAFNSAGTVVVNGGSTATFNNTASFNNLNVIGATAVLNGLNNTINALSLASLATMQGAGNTDVNVSFDWSESTVSHNLNANGTVTVPFITSGATVNGGVVTLTGTSTTTVSQQIDIIGTGQLINQGAMSIVEARGSIASTDGTGIFNNLGGTVAYSGGTGGSVAIGGNTALTFITTGTLNADGGTINLNPTNPVQWDGGTWTGLSGLGLISFNTALDIGGNAVKTIDGITLNTPASANVTFTGDGDLDIINSGTFLLNLGSVITHSSNADILSSDGTGVVTAGGGGTFTKTAGVTNVEAALLVNDINITGGTLILSVPGNPTDTSIYSLSNGGVLQVNADRVFANASYDFTGGTFRVDNGATVVMNPNTGAVSSFDNLILAGNSTIAGNNTIEISGVFDWLSGAMTSAGGLNILTTGVLNLSDAAAVGALFFNDGQVNVLNGGTLSLLNNGVFSGGFDIASGGAIDINNGSYSFVSGITGNGTLIIRGVSSSVDLAQASTIGDLQFSDGVLFGSSLTASGLSTWSGGNISTVVNFNGGVDITQTVVLDGTVNVSGGSIDNTATVVNGGSGTAAFNLDGGVFTVGTTGVQSIETGVALNTGAVLDVQGILDVSAASPTGVTNNGGTITGGGEIIGNVTNNGIIAPGNAIGALTISGDLLLQQNSVIAIEVAAGDATVPGDQAGVQYDALNVAGLTTLDGELQVQVAQDASLSLQDTLLPVSAGSVAAGTAFARVAPSPGYQFELDGLELVTLAVPDLVIIDPVGSDVITLTRSVEEIDTLMDSLDALTSPLLEDEDERESATLVCS